MLNIVLLRKYDHIVFYTCVYKVMFIMSEYFFSFENMK